jgi:DNA-binding PadR family transcriptional regulator
MKENKSKYAILGILSLGPISGYDIKKLFQRSIANFWNESYGQIYPLLRTLVAEGLATRSIKKQLGKPDRHLYSITDKGLGELQMWLIGPVKDQIGRIEIGLKIFFGHQLEVVDNIRQIEHYREMREQELKALIAIEERLKTEQANKPNLPYMLMTVSYGQHVNQALLQWCEETLSALKKMNQRSDKNEKSFFASCSKTPRCKAPEILRVASRRIRSDILPRRRVSESARDVLGGTPQ